MRKLWAIYSANPSSPICSESVGEHDNYFLSFITLSAHDQEIPHTLTPLGRPECMPGIHGPER